MQLKQKTTIKLLDNQLFKTNLRANSEIITILHFNELYYSFKTIKELKNGNFLLLFGDALYYICSKTFKKLEVDKSLNKYYNERFSYFEEINEELIGIISKNFVLIFQINKTELKFVQEIKIKAKVLRSFPSENLIVINEYINEKDKNLNILNYYTYDKNLIFQLKTREEINFQHLLKEENI